MQAGEVVGQELPLMWLSGRDNPVVIAYLEPKHLEFVAIGQNASVKLPTGDTFRAQINEPTELVGKLPKYLSGPFDGEKPVLKVTLTIFLPEILLIVIPAMTLLRKLVV